MSTATRQYMPPNGRLQTTNLPRPSDVPRAVASLLETTKQLQETLRLWSISVVAFQKFGIDLSEDPSPHALNKYLPRVRQIIATLLRGLQSKQAAYWHAVGDSPMRR